MKITYFLEIEPSPIRSKKFEIELESYSLEQALKDFIFTTTLTPDHREMIDMLCRFSSVNQSIRKVTCRGYIGSYFNQKDKPYVEHGYLDVFFTSCQYDGSGRSVTFAADYGHLIGRYLPT